MSQVQLTLFPIIETKDNPWDLFELHGYPIPRIGHPIQVNICAPIIYDPDRRLEEMECCYHYCELVVIVGEYNQDYFIADFSLDVSQNESWKRNWNLDQNRKILLQKNQNEISIPFVYFEGLLREHNKGNFLLPDDLRAFMEEWGR